MKWIKLKTFIPDKRKIKKKNFVDSKIQLIKLNGGFLSPQEKVRKLFFIKEEKESKKISPQKRRKEVWKVFLFNLNLDLDASEKLSIHMMNGN